MRVVLEVVKGPRTGRMYLFDRHTTFVVGRSRYAHCPVPEDTVLSRDHFLIEIRPPQCLVRDLGSTNGTFVNDQRVTLARLASGDRIAAGKSVFQVRVEHATALSEPSPDAPEGQPTPLSELHAGRVACHGCGTPAPEDVDVVHGSWYHAADSIAWLCEGCRAQAAESPQPVPEYTIIRQLGRGAMGVVHLARHNTSGRMVALKLIVPEVAATRSAIERFGREVDVLKRLQHRHIVQLLDHGLNGGRIWLAMEYVEGPSVEDIACQHPGTYPVDRACRLIMQVLRGLEHAHALGIVHRDVKPENILIGLGPNGTRNVKVSDFGLAKCYRGIGFSGLTFSGELRGTIPFMPPEQVVDFRAVLPAGDLYAAAATLYYLITSQPVHDLPSDGGDMLRVLLEEPSIPIRGRRPEVEPALEAVLEKCLERDPADRYPTARAMRQALKPFCRTP